MKFLFLGTGGLLSSIVLEKLCKEKLYPFQVYLQPSLKNFPNLTELVCNKYNLKYTFTKDINSEEKIKEIKSIQPLFVFTASFGQILSSKLLDVSNFFNLHMGILPQYKGALTNFWKIKQGHDVFGATIHQMSEKIDSGKIVKTIEKDFSNIINGFELISQNYQMAADLLSEAIKNNLFSKTEFFYEPKEKGNYYPKVEEKDFEINIFDDTLKTYKVINRLQFYGTPFYFENKNKLEVQSASIIYIGDHKFEYNTILKVSKKTKHVYTKKGILQINL